MLRLSNPARRAVREVADRYRAPTGRRRNPDDLPTARRVGRDFGRELFRGEPRGDVAILSERERRLPRNVAILGPVTALVYERDGVEYEHEIGDRGGGRAANPRRPLLGADPVTRRPLLLSQGTAVRATRRGLVG